MRTMIRAALSVVSLMLTAAPARADLIIWHLHGVVETLEEESNPLLYGTDPFHVGDRLDLVVHVDTAAPDSCDQPDQGSYSLPFAALLHNGTIYPPEPGNAGVVEVDNAAGNCSGFGVPYGGVEIRLTVGPVGMTFLKDSTDDPDSFNLLPLFEGGGGGFFGLVGGSYGDFTFDQAQIVPEPTTLFLVFSGLAAAATRRRPRRSKEGSPSHCE